MDFGTVLQSTNGTLTATGWEAARPPMVENGRSLMQLGAMGPVKRMTVTLRFRGDDLDPRELTKRLGSPPTGAASKGGTWLTPSGAERVAVTGWWRLRLEAGDADTFEDQIAQLFATLSPDCATWRDLSKRYGGNLFVGVFLGSSNEGLTIAPEAALAIGERGLELQLDIYERDRD